MREGAQDPTRLSQDVPSSDELTRERSLEGKVAVVTGAAQGIGRAYALALAAEGAAVALNDLRAGTDSDLEAVAVEIRDTGGQAIAVAGDVAEFDDVVQLMQTAEDQFGAVHIAVANAGVSRPAPISEMTSKDWLLTVGVHLNGTFNVIRSASESIVRAGGGTIITTGDITTGLFFPGLAAYRSAKAAIAVLTLYAARELVEQGVNVNSVMPPATDTDMMHAFFDSLGDGLESFLRSPTSLSGEQVVAPSGSSRSAVAASVIPPLGIYLCTEEGRATTGSLFTLYGNRLRRVTIESGFSELAPDGEVFTLAELRRRAPAWLDEVPNAPSQASA